jgi:hypothetical protein
LFFGDLIFFEQNLRVHASLILAVSADVCLVRLRQSRLARAVEIVELVEPHVGGVAEAVRRDDVEIIAASAKGLGVEGEVALAVLLLGEVAEANLLRFGVTENDV